MDRSVSLLNTLRIKLTRNHQGRIEKSLAAKVTFEDAPRGEFVLVVDFQHPVGLTPFRKTFTRPYVFGGSFSMSPSSWNICKKVCDFATDTIREAQENWKAQRDGKT
jgi:hypothetical protein